MIAKTTANWNRRQATPVSSDDMGRPVFGTVDGYPKDVQGVFYENARRSITTSTGEKVEIDAMLISDTFPDGKVGDKVIVKGVEYRCVDAPTFESPVTGVFDHGEYALQLLTTKEGAG